MNHLYLAEPHEEQTIAGTISHRLRSDILSGALEPGTKLQMRALVERYEIGQTPLREALNRLAAEGLVETKAQRGFFVSPITRNELEEFTKTRCWLEEIALRESITNGGQDWEEELIVAQYRLQRTPRSLDPLVFKDNPEWEKHHRNFHEVLLSRCGSSTLLNFCNQLADRLYRYRMISISRVFAKRPVADEHSAIAEAALARDIDRATKLLMQHYTRTAVVLLESLAE
ncbi:GntR family transcriptional regulator [Pseudooceanicola spongiae]|uniref:FCD domain-containing protein n=1 Tax=Pseudooceanicola spongiae TaxID=2613965 RepID=A0A7L9WRU0_9RHOB|nr:GntR family transcriptional regulator [Pseudooceanicola spongiae]QOL83009.1 FCD domain-containing protein [Pseudooceanicola spongiae]